MGRVPECQEVDDPWKEPRFKGTEEKAHGSESAKVLHPTKYHNHGTPSEHEEREPARGEELFQHVIGRCFEDRVCDEEYHECVKILFVGNMDRLVERVTFVRIEHFSVALWSNKW